MRGGAGLTRIVLDLFSGYGGFSYAFGLRGWKVYRVELNPKQRAEFHMDVMRFDPIRFAETYGRPTIVLASPPCTTFSVAAISNHFKNVNGKLVPRDYRAHDGLRLVQHTLDIIDTLQPDAWLIENPRGALRKMALMEPYERRTITQCQYGESRMKPTDLWGGFPRHLELKPPCRNGDPCHARAPRGKSDGGGTQAEKNVANRSMIPFKLSQAICLAMEKQLVHAEAP